MASTATVNAKSKPGIFSARVGICGASGERVVELVARRRAWPDLTKPMSDGGEANTMSTCPPIIAGTETALPLNGRCVIEMPRLAFIASIVKWWMLPLPAEP